MLDLVTLELILLLVFGPTAIRTIYLLYITRSGQTKYAQRRTHPARTLICMGSGGHTTEMLILLETLDEDKYNPRYYIIADTDRTSRFKVSQFETTRHNSNHYIEEIPRSRVVNQSFFTSVFTTLRSIFCCVGLVYKVMPDLILCNGPGTCVPICVAAFILKVAFICNSRIVFVESFCRTQTFSLTGKILAYFADNIVVQWPRLKEKIKRSDYVGRLM